MKHSAVNLVLSAIVVFAMTAPAAAEVYKWTDANGVVHYSDQKPEDEEVTELGFSVTTNDSFNPHKSV